MAWLGGVTDGLAPLLPLNWNGMGGGTGGGAVGSFTCGDGDKESFDGAGCGLLSADSAGVAPSGKVGSLFGVIVGSGGWTGGRRSAPSGWAFSAAIGVGVLVSGPVLSAWLTSSRALWRCELWTDCSISVNVWGLLSGMGTTGSGAGGGGIVVGRGATTATGSGGV